MWRVSGISALSCVHATSGVVQAASATVRMDEPDDPPSMLGDTGLSASAKSAPATALSRGDLANLVRRLQRSRPSADAPTTRCSRMRTAGDPSGGVLHLGERGAHLRYIGPGTCASPLRAPVAFAL
jgi:hypothetical protein